MKSDPCYKCPDRKVTKEYNCHSNCPRYAEQVEDCKKRREYNNGYNSDYMNYKNSLMEKRIKRKNEKNRV